MSGESPVHRVVSGGRLVGALGGGGAEKVALPSMSKSVHSGLGLLQEMAQAQGGVPMKIKKMLVKGRGLGHRVERSCFSGSDAVSWVLSHSPQLTTRAAAARQLQAWLEQRHIRSLGKETDQFEDDKASLYFFTSDDVAQPTKKVKKNKLRVRAPRDQPPFEQLSESAMMEFLSSLLFLPHQWIPSCLMKTSVARSKVTGARTRARDAHFVALCSRSSGGANAEWSLQLGRYKENKAEYQLTNVWPLRNVVAYDKIPGGFAVNIRRKETSEGSVQYIFTSANAGPMLQALARACNSGRIPAKTTFDVRAAVQTAGASTGLRASEEVEEAAEVSIDSIDSLGSVQLSPEDLEAQKLMWLWMQSHGHTSASAAHELLEAEVRDLERGLMRQLMELDGELQRIHDQVEGVAGSVDEVIRWIDDAAPVIREGEGHIRDIRGHRARREREQRHLRDLTGTLQVLLNSLSVPPRLLSILRSPSFGHDDVGDMVSALHAVDRVITLRDLDQRLLEMRAVSDRSAEYRQSVEHFGQSLLEHCHSLLSDRATARGATSSVAAPNALHLHLGPFVPVFKALPRAVIPPLMEDYMLVCKPVYSREFKQYCSHLLTGVRKKEHTCVEGFSVALDAVSGLLNAERSFWFAFQGSEGDESGDAAGPARKSSKVLGFAASSADSKVAMLFEQGISAILIVLCEDLAMFLDYSSRHASGEVFGHQSVCTEWRAQNQSSSVIEAIASALNNVALQVVQRYTQDAVDRMRESHMTRSHTGPLQSFIRLPETLDDIHHYGVTPLTSSVCEKLMGSMLDWLESPEVVKELIKFDSSKKTVFAGRLENYYFLHAVLSRYEAKCDYLRPFSSICMERYQQNLMSFMSFVYEAIFESMHEYFSSLQKMLKTVPAEEIQFQVTLSRTALQGLNRKYTPAVWEKKVLKLRKSVLKTISANMVDNVWSSLLDFLKEKLNFYNELILLCYGDTSVSIRVDDLAKFFDKARASVKL